MLFSFIGLKEIQNVEKLYKSIFKFYKNINNLDSFNCLYTLFSRFNLNKKTFNNSRQLIFLKKKRNSKNTFKGCIKFKTKFLYTNIFIKEIPILNPIILNNNNINNICDYYYRFKSEFYFNSECNIELFINYICSKLVELNMSPHFCYFYGFTRCNKNFIYILNKDEFDLIKNIDYKKYNIKLYKKKNKYILERNNFPCILLYSEKLDIDLHSLIKYKNISDDEWLSIIFQILFALTQVQNKYNLSHNDLHSGNILFKKTEKSFLFYKIKSKYYKIPTFNKIYKIIDWGRGTFNINNFIGNNNVFDINGEAFGQFVNKKVNNKGIKEIKFNKSNDLCILADSILSLNKINIETDLFQFINSWLFSKKLNKFITSENMSKFDFYKQCSYGDKLPNKEIENNIFNKFIVKNVDKDSLIYNI